MFEPVLAIEKGADQVAQHAGVGEAGKRDLTAITLAALGVVFGDIGTSPLYTLKTVLGLSGGEPRPEIVLGVLSLIFWTLIIVVTIKYVAIAMRIDNDGEGGILALMALVGGQSHKRPLIVAAGIFGAALIYGDGAITPAISVLSALEGLEMATPVLTPYIVPLAVIVLAALFLFQPQGTARIGRAFGPIVLVWFIVMALLGLGGIAQHPAILAAINPFYGASYLIGSGLTGFLVLGGVFLCVTGAEALYADMGHFGPEPIRRAWLVIVFPSLLLNYAGQGAYLLAHPGSTGNVFYLLCPPVLLLPLVILATLATIIASQAIITGAFSMTRQAIRLGWMPRMHITQTSHDGYGQIYVGPVNWLLMAVTIGLTIAFKKSDNLASAYGIAVASTMLITTMFLFIAMREIWHWSVLRAGAVAGVLLIVDATFFGANLVKIADGGYVPVGLACLIFAVMYIWHRGIASVSERVTEHPVPIAEFIASLPSRGIARVQGTAIFLSREKNETPPVVSWYVDHAHALQEHVVIVTVESALVPWIDEKERATMSEIAPDFWRVLARYGFMERPDVTQLLANLKAAGCNVEVGEGTYFIGLETIEPRDDAKGLPRWMVLIFAALQRNAVHVSDAFNFPRDRVVEIGRRVSI